MSHWTLFSNHGHVLLYVSHQPEARLRDIADRVGITERAVQKIVRDLQDGGLVSVIKHGRCNRYQVHGSSPLRHELEAHCSVADLVGLIHADTAPGMLDEAAGRVTALLEEIGSTLAEAADEVEAAAEDIAPDSEPDAQPEPPPAPEPEAATKQEPETPEPANRKRARKRTGPNGGEQGSLF